MTDEDVALGIDFGGTKAALVVGDRQGTIYFQQRLNHEPGATAISIVRRTFGRAQSLVSDYAVGRIGIATMGITRSDEVWLAPNVPGWSTLALPRMTAQ